MADNDLDNRYKPEPDFVEDTRAPVLPISVSDSAELWLIKWPINQLQPTDFHGKELCLKLHRDGKLASFKNSSGKSYEVVSFTAQEPDATVFIPSSSDSKVVGKISRCVSLVHYPDPGDIYKPSFSNPNFSALKLEGSKMKTLSHFPAMHRHGSQDKSTCETSASVRSIRKGIFETPHQNSKKRKHKDRSPASKSSIASEQKSQITTATTNGSPQSKSKKRNVQV